MDFGKFAEYGLIGLVVAALFFLIWRWSVWIMGWIRERDMQQAAERKAWADIIDRMNECWAAHTAQAKQFHDSVTEAHKFQREEHKEMIITLGRINGYKQ